MLQSALVFGVLGYLFSSRTLITFLNGLSPFQGLLFYYVQLFVTLEILQSLGLVIGGIKLTSPLQTLGELMIIFAFFILVVQKSQWVEHVIEEQTGQPQNYPVIFVHSEDGATYAFWRQFAEPETARILTFVVTPAVLVALGTYLMGFKRIQRSLLT
jgi:hypothetical protein